MRDIGIHMNGNGKPKAGTHTAGISSKRKINMFANISKINNILHHILDIRIFQSLIRYPYI